MSGAIPALRHVFIVWSLVKQRCRFTLRQGREADHPPQPSDEVKNAWSCTSVPPVSLHGMVLVKHRDNFNFLPFYKFTFT